MRRSIFVLCFVTLFAGFAFAQAKTVTNADLEKYRQKREAGERNLKVYYAKKGMTEADVAKQEAENAKAREELSARLRSERLEREWLEQMTTRPPGRTLSAANATSPPMSSAENRSMTSIRVMEPSALSSNAAR